MNKELLKEAVLENFKWIDKILYSGLALSLTITLLKIFGRKSVKWMDVEFDLSQAWVIFLLLTIAHLYITVLLMQSIKKLWEKASVEDRNFVFGKVTATGGLLSRGLIARIEVRNLDSIKYPISYKDPSAWATYAGSVLLVTAIVPFPLYHILNFTFVIAAFLLNANWILGTNWIIALSELSLARRQSLVFKRINLMGYIGPLDKEVSYKNMSYIVFPFWFVITALVSTVTLPLSFIYSLLTQALFKHHTQFGDDESETSI